MSSPRPIFEKEQHIRYFLACLQTLPNAYQGLDTNRLTLVHFAVHSLNLLNSLDHSDIDKPNIINWIYSLLTLPDTTIDDDDSGKYSDHVGFKGGTYLGNTFQCSNDNNHTTYEGWEYDHGHIAMTYTALLTLQALGDDLSRVNKPAILRSLKHLQLPDGSFKCISVGSENDMRFLYCACAISNILQDWSAVDIPKAVSFIQNCRSYDGAFALNPGLEGNGGPTFCAVASLVLMQKEKEVLDDDDNPLFSWRKSLIQWCINRQQHPSTISNNKMTSFVSAGMQGRPNKDEDTCYSYWIGGTLELLNAVQYIDPVRLKNYVFSCQTLYGGFGKVLGANPDLLHSFYSLCWLSLCQKYLIDDTDKDYSLNDLDCVLGVVRRR